MSVPLAPLMPPRAPLAMPVRALDGRVSRRAPGVRRPAPWRARLAVLIPAVAITALIVAIFADWFARNALHPLEVAILFTVALTTFGIALSMPLTLLGLRRRARTARSGRPARALDVALLVPVYEEDATSVARRIAAMRDALARESGVHRYRVFLLSDTREAANAAAERAAVERFARLRHDVPVHWRRRAHNADRKVGNVRDWVESHGGAFDAFVTLDADSTMSAAAIAALADAMAGDPRAGLIQTVPRLVGARTLFGRMQQFAANTYGGALGAGIALWSGDDGNYWGHNAIIRTRAFAETCGLPRLSGDGPLSGTIKSHDFVEAALLRRAGWRVTVRADLEGSWEETPQTLVDHILRDRRWCQGNLQHLRILPTAGLTFGSRFHMLQGAMAYIASLLWCVLLLLWLSLGTDGDNGVWQYFTDANPTIPVWPRMDVVDRAVVLGAMIALLLAPKIAGVARTVMDERASHGTLARLGGGGTFAANCLIEILLSALLAPVLMVQQLLAVLRTIAGFDTGWAPQARQVRRLGWIELARFHGVETGAGLALALALAAGHASLWFAPIAVSLVLAVPISRCSAARVGPRVLATVEHVDPAPVLRAAGYAPAMPVAARPLIVGKPVQNAPS